MLEIYSRSFITIDGIIFDASNIPTCHAAYIGRTLVTNIASTFITMQNCTVKNSPNFSGILAGRHQEGVSCNFSFVNTNSHGHGLNATDGRMHHGMYIVGRDITVDGGSYYNNSGHGVHVFKQDATSATDNAVIRNIRAYENGSCGIGLYSGSNLMAYNNLIYGNGISTGSGGIVTRYGATGVKIHNNTVYNNAGPGIFVEGRPATVINNIVDRMARPPEGTQLLRLQLCQTT